MDNSGADAFYSSVIFDVANKFLDKENRLNDSQSIMPSGHNGPYFDLETPVRNSAHWLYAYSVLYRSTKDVRYYDTANRLADFLLAPSPHIKDGVYIQRQKPGKDWCNGVIGQAWVIEGLNIASHCLNRPELKVAAVNAAKAFPFNHAVGAWEKIDPYNGKKAIDYTLNHQTWFAAALIELNEPTLNKNVVQYLDGLQAGAMRVRKDGVIAHLLYKSSFKGTLLQLRYKLSEKRSWKKVREKEMGYHLFNLHPLARVYKCMPGHTFFSSELFKMSLDIAFRDSFVEELAQSQYAYPYNAPAFEYPLVSAVFNKTCPDSIFSTQVEKTLFKEMSSFGNCPDANTLNARVYEFFI